MTGDGFVYLMFTLTVAVGLLAGAFGVLAYYVKHLEDCVNDRKKELKSIQDEFKDTVEIASRSNNSHANQIIEISKLVDEIKSRQDMLDNTIRMTGKSGVWKN